MWIWWSTIISELGSLRQDFFEFEAVLGYLVSSRQDCTSTYDTVSKKHPEGEAGGAEGGEKNSKEKEFVYRCSHYFFYDFLHNYFHYECPILLAIDTYEDLFCQK